MSFTSSNLENKSWTADAPPGRGSRPPIKTGWTRAPFWTKDPMGIIPSRSSRLGQVSFGLAVAAAVLLAAAYIVAARDGQFGHGKPFPLSWSWKYYFSLHAEPLSYEKSPENDAAYAALLNVRFGVAAVFYGLVAPGVAAALVLGTMAYRKRGFLKFYAVWGLVVAGATGAIALLMAQLANV